MSLLKNIKSTRLGILILALAMTLTFVAIASAEEASSPKYYSLTVIHTNDFHDYEPMALARKSTLIEQIRSGAKNSLLLDAGDIFNRGKYHTIFYGELEIAAMNAMKYDAWTLGNNEFKCDVDGPKSQAHIERRASQATFPTLCANITYKDGTPLRGVVPYIVKEVGGVKVGIFGVTNSNKVKTYTQAANLTVVDVVESAKKLVPIVAKEADIVIALSHGGLALDLALSGVPGISAIITADDHTIIPKPIIQNGVPMVQTGGEQNQFLGRLDLLFELKAGKWVLIDHDGELLPVGEKVFADPKVKVIVEDYLAKAKPAA